MEKTRVLFDLPISRPPNLPEFMKICQYAPGRAGAVEQDRVYPLGEALIVAGYLRNGYTMLEVIEALANHPAAMAAARKCVKTGPSLPLASVKLLAPILNYIFGYTMCWDFSQRDPWGRGGNNTRNIRKGFDTFTGLGPWIVTRDEIPDPQNLSILVEQNGQVVVS